MRVCSVCRRCYDDRVASCADAMHPPLSDSRDGATDVIAGYRLESLIESGIEGEIYRAERVESGQSCIIRIVSADETTTEQFFREAKLAVSLFNPSVVDTYEVGPLASGEVFAVSEDAEGRTLREFLDDRGKPELLTSIEIIRQAAEALHTLHQNGLHHGAVRPENVVLTAAPSRGVRVRIQHADFGGVATRSIISNKFSIDSALNSLRYFAPEQCSGAEPSAQGDVYSLGIVFYEMLAGAPPFDASKAVGLIEKHRSQTPPDVKIDNFDLRMLVTHSLTEALQKQPRMRQSSADLFARQLRHIEQLATHTSTPPPAGVIRKPVLPKRPVPTTAPIAPPRVIAAPEKVHPIESSTNVRTELYPTDNVAEPVAVEPVAHKAPILESSRVRLSSWKKKVQSLAVDLAAEIKPRAASILSSIETRRSETLSIASAADENYVHPARKKIEWQTPDDDIPSEAAALEVRAKEGIAPEEILPGTVTEPMIESRVVAAAPVEIPRVEETTLEESKAPVENPPAEKRQIPEVIPEPVAAKPTQIRAIKSEDATRVIPKRKPAMPERVAPVAVVATKDADPAIRPTMSPTPKPKRSGLGFKVNLADLEEITLVRPPSKRIRIDWERAVPRPDLSNVRTPPPVRKTASPAAVFEPTILGSTRSPKVVAPESREEMFGAYPIDPNASRSLPYRSMAIGGVIAIVIGVALLSSDPITEYFQPTSSAESVASTASSSEEKTAAPIVTPQAKQKALRIVEKAPFEKEEKKKASAETPKVPARETAKKPEPASIMKSVTARKPDSKKQTPDRPPRVVEKVSSPAPEKKGAATRPRIVNVQN